MSVSAAQLTAIRETVLRQLDELPARIAELGLNERDLEWVLTHRKDDELGANLDDLGLSKVLSRLAWPLIRSIPVCFSVYEGALSHLVSEMVAELSPVRYAPWGKNTPFPLERAADPEVSGAATYELVWFERQIDICRIAAVLHGRGYEPASLREVLSLVKHDPAIMEGVSCLFGLGSTWSQVNNPGLPHAEMFKTWLFPCIRSAHPLVDRREGMMLCASDQRVYATKSCRFLVRKMGQ